MRSHPAMDRESAFCFCFGAQEKGPVDEASRYPQLAWALSRLPMEGSRRQRFFVALSQLFSSGKAASRRSLSLVSSIPQWT